MNSYADLVKSSLTSIISEMSKVKELFVKTPDKDFTRTRKMPFHKCMLQIITMGGKSIERELLESHNFSSDTPTTSAFVQQRDKILPCAFEYLLHEFNNTNEKIKTFRGYRLLADDGSSLLIPTDPKDSDTYFAHKSGNKGYNLLHLNAMYDLINNIYVDAIIQPGRSPHEQLALTNMVKRSKIEEKTILIADRNFESYNIFANLDAKNRNYVIRVKDQNGGIAETLPLPDTEEFDVWVKRILTRRRTKAVKAQPLLYRFTPASVPFDFLDVDSKDEFHISFRVVRILLENGEYETLITNLPSDEFSAADIKELYFMRWGIETSFRTLKYTIGLSYYHSKKRECIEQEVFARMIMYNLVEMITSNVDIPQEDKRYHYKANFTIATLVCRNFMQSWNNAPPPDVEAVIRKNILPFRPDRTFKRNIRSQSVASFFYRLA